jgi:hypothetical protein
MARNNPNNANKEEERILKQALHAFQATTDMGISIQKAYRPREGADAEVLLEGGQKLLVEVKRSVTPATIGAVAAQVAGFGKPGILVTRYITPPMAERLKALDIGFLDTAGNAYLHTPNLFVYVAGIKPQNPTKRERTVRALRPTGLKVIFALLCLEDLLNAPYREIAQAAGVALGTVGWVFYDLKRLGYIREAKAGRKYEDRPGLVNKWVEAYAQELRPKLKPKRYRVEKTDWWKRENLTGLDMWLGGEPAAAVLTKHLRPEIATIYGDTQFAALAKRIKPVKDEYGNLEVLHKFWEFDIPARVKKYPLVPPLLIYADLVATGDARNIETAQIIKERFLEKE